MTEKVPLSHIPFIEKCTPFTYRHKNTVSLFVNPRNGVNDVVLSKLKDTVAVTKIRGFSWHFLTNRAPETGLAVVKRLVWRISRAFIIPFSQISLV